MTVETAVYNIQKKSEKLFRNAYLILISFFFLLFISFCSGEDLSLKGKFVKGRYAGNVFEDKDVRALAVAAAGGDTFSVYELIHEKKINVNSQGKDGITPLLWAFLAKNKDGYRELLKNGANPDLEAKDVFSVTGLALGYTDDTEYFKLALEYGANPDHIYKRIGLPLIMNACMAKFNKDQLKWLVEAGADINIKGVQGNTPVMFCAEMRRYDLVLYLLERGSDYKTADNDGTDLKKKILDNTIDPELDPVQNEYREKALEIISR